MRRWFAAWFPILVALSGCSLFESGTGDGGAVTVPTSEPIPSGSVLVQGIAFNPERVAVATGETVTWTVEDGGLKHTITADDGGFDSGEKTDGEFTHTFAGPGEFAYHCNVHAAMSGVVVVG